MNDLIIFGTGGHAKAIIDIVESTKQWKIKGLVSEKENFGKLVLGYKILGSDEHLKNLSLQINNVLIGIGQIGIDERRKKFIRKINKFRFNFPTIKSKFAIISKNAILDEGTTIGHGAVINTCSQIGKHCIINSSSLIEHGVKIGDFCHISTGAIINGDVTIGEGSFIGSGAIIREGLVLPPETVISAGKRIMGWPNREN